MKFKFLFLFVFLTPFLSKSQNSNRSKDIYLDSEGDIISNNEFREQWGNKSRWNYINDDGIRVNTLNDTVFLTLKTNYGILKSKLEEIIQKNIPLDAIILIEYYFKDDLCSNPKLENDWSKSRIRRRKRFLKSYKESLEKSSDVFIVFLFAEGIQLDSNPDDKSEYFYTDKNNFIQKNIFPTPTLCGSFAAIKPNDDILVENGENRIDLLAQYLKDENWNKFFPEQEDR